MASGFEMRVGDSEREAAAAELREHFASGRLTLEEFNERTDKAFAAKTRGDLNALMSDLPSARPHAAGPAGPASLGGPGSSWSGPGSGWSGPGAGWGPGGSGQGAGWTGPGGGYGRGAWSAGMCGARRTVGAIITSCVLICALAVAGLFGIFDGGLGLGRPIGFGLLILAFGMLRRLIFGRRRVRSRPARGRRRW